MPLAEAPAAAVSMDAPPLSPVISGVRPMEHLHLHLRRTHWETKYHSNLGIHLQDALDALDREGWEVVTAFTINISPEFILRRPRPD